MFGPGLFSVFRSRWKALWWAAGILMTAYCTIPSPEESAQPGPNSADVKAVQDALQNAGNSSSE
ncbi:MAG: hypothetical protein JSR28_17215 [Proteobacteria bacterium]|nr:hypothetical protein [Pseudomonadota bacterium]